MSGTPIILERETANDESATLVKIYVESDASVAADDLIFDIENSKATQELRAPRAGILEHYLHVGDTVEFGVAIATLYSEDEWTNRRGMNAGEKPIDKGTQDKGREGRSHPAAQEPPRASIPTGPQNNPSIGSALPQFSRAAIDLITQHAIDRSDFSAQFVVADDVKKRLGLLRSADLPQSSYSRPIERRSEGQPMVGRKRAEIEALGGGAGGTLLSVLGLKLGNISIPRDSLDFLDNRITDVVIYEASRLLRKFPNLNSYFSEGRVSRHESVHAGLAIDGGGNLVVYGIQDADKLSLRELSNAIADAAARYEKNELTASELSRATFTVTDLSDANLDFVFPLLPKGQGLILGITRSDRQGFNVFAGFDHRVTEGREVALFLSDLRERLNSFDSPSRRSADRSVRCRYCDTSAIDAISKNSDRGLLKVIDQDGHEVLCCASCWNGW
jgi:pyruvate/2-oxoglutarate dehydrogenase complex dihydrolipoamide acyltransferase (E2) component